MWLKWIEGQTDADGAPLMVSVDSVPTLEDLQSVVGGYIEPIDLWEDERGVVSLWVNEDGLNFNLPMTVWLTSTQWEPQRPAFGQWAISRTDMTTGDMVAMTTEDVQRIHFAEAFVITRFGVLPTLEIH